MVDRSEARAGTMIGLRLPVVTPQFGLEFFDRYSGTPRVADQLAEPRFCNPHSPRTGLLR